MSNLEMALNDLIYQAERRNAELSRELFRAERLAVAYQRLSALNAEAERAVIETMGILSQGEVSGKIRAQNTPPAVRRVA